MPKISAAQIQNKRRISGNDEYDISDHFKPIAQNDNPGFVFYFFRHNLKFAYSSYNNFNSHPGAAVHNFFRVHQTSVSLYIGLN